MPPRFPSCPHLPSVRDGLDWRDLHAFRRGPRGAEFYLACLEYAQALWTLGLAARALLCLDRAMGADLTGIEPVLIPWPMPYAAVGWIVAYTPATVFIGNPRVHFQHYADRMNEPRRDQRRGRAWACWAIVRQARPEWPGDPRHQVREPALHEIEAALHRHGLPGEAGRWKSALGGATKTSPRPAPCAVPASVSIGK